MEPNNLLSYINVIKLLENFYHHKNFSITSIVVESLNEKVTGMMAEYYKLILYVKIGDQNFQQNFFCKKLIMFHKIQEIMGKAQGAYEKEEFIYKKFLETLETLEKNGKSQTFAPKCYLTINHDIFILEELLEKGYKVHDEDFDLRHFQIGLKTIAKFHAASILIEENGKINLFEENPGIFEDSLYRRSESYLGRQWFKNCVGATLKLIELLPEVSLSKAELRQKYTETTNRVYEIISPSKKFRNVVCHGDLSKLNILFQYDPHGNPLDSKIVDFQALRYNPPAHDVVNFMYLCSSYVFRQKHFWDLCNFYYTSLQECLRDCGLEIGKYISKDSFLQSIDFVRPQAIVQKCFYNTMRPVIKFYPHILKDQDLYKKYVYEDRSSEVLEVFGKCEEFREMMVDNFKEFCEIVS